MDLISPPPLILGFWREKTDRWKMTVAHLNWVDFPASDPSTGDINEYLIGLVASPSIDVMLQAGFIAGVCQGLVTGGVLCITYQYYDECKSDSIYKKAIVGCLVVLAIIEVVITNVDVSRLFLHASEYAKIHRLNLVLSTCSIFITGLSTLLMQICFVWRGYVLWNKPSWFLPVFGFLTTAMFFSVTFVFSVAMTCPYYDQNTTRESAGASMHLFMKYGTIVAPASRLQGIMLIVSDTAITIALSIGLYRSKTGFKATDTLIDKLMIALTESMFPPFALALAFASMVFSELGPSSWLRIPASMQAAIYLHAVVSALLLRVRRDVGSRSAQTLHFSGENKAVHTRSRPIISRVGVDDDLDESERAFAGTRKMHDGDGEYYVMHDVDSKNTLAPLNPSPQVPHNGILVTVQREVM